MIQSPTVNLRAGGLLPPRRAGKRGPPVLIQQLGHVVLKVRELARSEQFYGGVLGLLIVARMAERQMTFFSLGHIHHDLAIQAVGIDAADAPARSPGLSHVAFKVGTSTDDLRRVHQYLMEAGPPSFE